MAYGTIKVDTVTFTSEGIDTSVSISGLVRNPTFSGNITSTSTISGVTIQGGTLVSGATVTGSAGQFTTITGGTVNFTTITGTTAVITSGVFASGTAAAPSVSVGTTTNGIYSPGANQVAITTSGTGRLFVASDGNVGIGIGNPVYLLDVLRPTAGTVGRFQANGTDSNVSVKNSSREGIVGADANQSYLLNTDAYPWTFWTNNQERLRITSDGKVGIGTSSPLTKLDVRNGVITAGSDSSTTGSEILRGYYSNTEGALAVIGTERSTGGIVLGCAVKPSTSTTDAFLSSTTINTARGAYTIAGNTHKWYLGGAQTVAENSSVSTSEVMRIDSSGRLLVGTSTAYGAFPAILQTQNNNGYAALFGKYANNNAGADIEFFKGRGGSPSVRGIVQNNDGLGVIVFSGDDGTNGSVQAAIIRAEVDGTPGANDMPGRLVFYTTADGASSSTERMVIKADGKVGIGTSSPGSPLTIESSAGNQVKITYPSIASYFLNATSGGDFAINKDGTERLRIDSSGRLLVGTSSAFTSTNPVSLQVAGGGVGIGTYVGATAGTYTLEFLKSRSSTVGGTAIVAASDNLGQISFNGTDGTQAVLAATIKAEVDGTPGANDMPGRLVFSTTADGASSPTERMRITSTGHIRVGTTNAPTGGQHQFDWAGVNRCNFRNVDATAANCYGILIEYTNAAPNGTGNEFLYCQDNTSGGTQRAVIRSNGGLANYQANDVNLSDRNVKKDIAPAAGTWNCIKEWEIVNYRYKDQPDDADLNLGVIAQQVAESCPEVITTFEEAKDDQPEKLGVKEQQMYWMAIKALQEAQLRIETLEAKVAALESA